MLTRGKVTAIFGAAVLGAAVPSYAAAITTLDLSLNYIGSTSSTLTTAQIKAGSLDSNPNLTVLTNAQLADETSAEHNYFEIDGAFTPGSGADANDTFFSITFSSTLTSQLTVTTPAGTSGNVAGKWIAINPTDPNSTDALFSANEAQAAANGGFTPILIQQTSASDSFYNLPMETGSAEGSPTDLGRFAVSINGPLTSTQSITISETNGANFEYWTNNTDGTTTTSTTTSAGVTGSAYTISVAGPAIIVTTPSNSTSVAAGGTINVANNAASGSDPATLSLLSITQGLNGTFGQIGLSNGSIAAGASQTGTISFSAPGVLDGVQVTGSLGFTMADGGSAEGATGTGPYSFPLTATVSGNVASTGAGATFGTALSANLAGGTDLTGVFSNTQRGDANGALGTTATFLYGTQATTGTITESWRTHTAAEDTVPVFSDVVDIEGVTAPVYVLAMTYNPSDLSPPTFDQELLQLGELVDGHWTSAAANDNGGDVTTTFFSGAWDGQTALGDYGVDPGTDGNYYVWAVLDHDATFAVIPEPASLGLLGLGAMGLLTRRKRRRA